MGGYGSGNGGRWAERPQEENFLRLDVRRLVKLGLLEHTERWGALTWSRGGKPFASIQLQRVSTHPQTLGELRLGYVRKGEQLSQVIALGTSPCHYGGARPWFFCPSCSARVGVLFGARLFTCRHCRKLSYQSQRVSTKDRLWEKRNRLWAKLGVHPSAGELGMFAAEKPKGMHWETFERLKQQAIWEQDKAIIGMSEELGFARV